MQLEDPIRINDKEYKLEDLPESTHGMLATVMNIDAQLDTFDKQMAVLKMARQGFYSQILLELDDHEQREKRRIQEDPDA